MAKGRKPKPVALKAAAGNPGKRALNHDQPAYPPLTGAEAPDWLENEAKQMWDLVVPMLCAEGLLTAADLHSVEVFCSAYKRWREAERLLDEMGLVIPTDSGSYVKNPASTIANDASRQMATFGANLGLDPASRQRLIGAAKKPASNPFSDL